MNRALLAALLCLTALPAFAQNAGQIERVKRGASCPHCNLFQADLSNLKLKGKDYSGARLRQATLTTAILSGARFAKADLRDVDAYGAVMTNADLQGADLTHATFVGAYLEGADLKGAKLDGTNFAGAEMRRARGLTQAQLDQACGDPTTRLPTGLHLAACR
jgi:uncharacterized protein YjbI with pentapeptide repeats